MGQSMGGTLALLAIVASISLGCRISGHPNERQSDEITLGREEIFVNFENGSTFSLVIEPDDSVTNLMGDIFQYKGVPWNRMQLRLGETRLDRRKKLSDYNIQAGATVTLEIYDDRGCRTAKLIVRTRDGRELPVVAQLDKFVSSLKDNITEGAGVERAQLRLLVEGKELKDERTLMSYGIYNGSTVNLGAPLEDCRREVTIFVKTLSSATIGVGVNLADTVSDLKAKIWQKTGVPASVQRLNANERPIVGEDRLCDLGLGAGSTVYMFLYSPQITSLDQVAGLEVSHVAPSVNPYRAPIFREAEDAKEEPEHGGRRPTTLYRDAHNWVVRSRTRPEWDLASFDPVAHLDPNPDCEESLRQYHLYREIAASPNAGEWYVVEAALNEARLSISLAVKPYRVAANLSSSVDRPRQWPGITLGGGSTDSASNPEQLVPLGADVNNWAPDVFSDSDVMRLFEVADRVRQALARANSQTGETTLSIAHQRRINRSILFTYLEALAGYRSSVESNQPSGYGACGICRDDLTIEPAIMLACEHAFHTDCILSWKTNMNQRGRVASCPSCRERFMLAYDALGKYELEAPELQNNHN